VRITDCPVTLQFADNSDPLRRITGGQIADCTAGELLLVQMPKTSMLHGDKGYDSDAIRRQVEARGAMPNIPAKARRWKSFFSPVLYRNRNAIERMFSRLKDFRRIATRHDRNAKHFLCRRLHRCNRQLLVVSPDPKTLTQNAISASTAP
jgi:transposase